MRAVNYHCEALSILDVYEFLSTSLFLMTLKLQAEYRNPSQILSPILSKTFFVAKKKRRRENMIFCIKGFCLGSSPVAVKITAKCGLCLACIFPYKDSIFDSRVLENFIQRPVYETKKPTSIMKATAINESSSFLKLWMFWQDTRQNWNWL